MGDEARRLLAELRERYARAGAPNHKAWYFAPGPGSEAALAELHEQGLIEPRGLRSGEIWRLSDSGQRAVTAGR